MSDEEAKVKAAFNVKCPHCEKGIVVQIKRTVIHKPEPGEYEDWAEALPDPQGKLFRAEQDPNVKAEAAAE